MVASGITAPPALISAICTLAELWSTKLNATDAPLAERTAPISPQESSLPPLTLTLNVAGCVGLGLGFGVGLELGFGVGLELDFGVEPLVEGTVPGAVVGACVAVPGAEDRAPGRLDAEAEECGAVRAADADDENVAGWAIVDVPCGAEAPATAPRCDDDAWLGPLSASPVATDAITTTAAADTSTARRSTRRGGVRARSP